MSKRPSLLKVSKRGPHRSRCARSSAGPAFADGGSTARNEPTAQRAREPRETLLIAWGAPQGIPPSSGLQGESPPLAAHGLGEGGGDLFDVVGLAHHRNLESVQGVEMIPPADGEDERLFLPGQ